MHDPTPQSVLAEALAQLTREYPHLPPLNWAITRDGTLTGTDHRAVQPYDVLRQFAVVLGGQIRPTTTFEVLGQTRQIHRLTTRWRDVALAVEVSEVQPDTSAAQRLVERINHLPGIQQIHVDGDSVTVHLRPRSLRGWKWWLSRFAIPADSLVPRGFDVIAEGRASGVTVQLIGLNVRLLSDVNATYARSV